MSSEVRVVQRSEWYLVRKLGFGEIRLAVFEDFSSVGFG